MTPPIGLGINTKAETKESREEISNHNKKYKLGEDEDCEMNEYLYVIQWEVQVHVRRSEGGWCRK
jgi:hypothetical protein